MEETDPKTYFRTLADHFIRYVAGSGQELGYFGGAKALHNPRRDEIVTRLAAFEEACLALGSVPMVRDRYGDEPVWERLTLQLVYQFVGKLSGPSFDAGVFETVWSSFWESLSEPEWTYMALANLRNFSGRSPTMDLGDEIVLLHRNPEQLAEMGWTERHLERFQRDLLEGGAPGTHVIFTKFAMAKTPENYTLGNDTITYDKIVRALLAMRLYKGGDVGIGPVWHFRQEKFDVGLLGGNASTISPSGKWFDIGTSYTLDDAELDDLRELYDQLRSYELSGDDAPVNVDLAIRAFSDSYDRYRFGRGDVRLVDAITAAEALVGTKVEITFRLAFRVASILAADDDERTTLFDLTKTYYDTRSRVVHGERLRPKHTASLQDQAALRDVIRRLIVGFVRLTNSAEKTYDRTFFAEQLDSALLHAGKRADLRVAMGFE